MAKQNSPLVLGTEPIGKLLTQYAIPAIIAMTASSLYNMADSIFIGHGVGGVSDFRPSLDLSVDELGGRLRFVGGSRRLYVGCREVGAERL